MMYRDEFKYQLQDDEDLRLEIFHLKKKLSNIGAENHVLKVKIRKLQNEIVKKDKEMDVVLDPRKSIDVRKILYERSASFVLNMKEKNDELLDLLHEKDIIIRRLQNQLDVTKLYSHTPKKQYQCKCSDHVELDNKIRQIQMKKPCFEKKKKNRTLSWTDESTLIEEEEEEEEESASGKIKDKYKNLSREHLLSIIENLKTNQSSRQTSSRKSSPESDLDRIELLCESPHEEIQQLHLHFLDMISEVHHLKNTIAQLQNNQEKTENVLKKKNTNIDKLVQEVKNLKRPKSRPRSRRCYSSTDLVERIYSADNVCARYQKEMKQMKTLEKDKKPKPKDSKRKHSTKDAMIQVDKIDSPASVTECVYVEKGSITITEKAAENKEYDYEDEIFEECDEESVAVN